MEIPMGYIDERDRIVVQPYRKDNHALSNQVHVWGHGQKCGGERHGKTLFKSAGGIGGDRERPVDYVRLVVEDGGHENLPRIGVSAVFEPNGGAVRLPVGADGVVYLDDNLGMRQEFDAGAVGQAGHRCPGRPTAD